MRVCDPAWRLNSCTFRILHLVLYYPVRCFYYFVPLMYIKKGGLDDGNPSLFNAVQFNEMAVKLNQHLSKTSEQKLYVTS